LFKFENFPRHKPKTTSIFRTKLLHWVAKMALLGPKDRVGPKIFGPKKTHTTRLDKVRT